MEDIQAVIARNLAKLRKSRGLSLDQTAELTGVSKAMLAQIEKGKSNPTVSTLWKIANGLQVSFSLFMKEEKPVIKTINISELDSIDDNDGKYRVYPFFPYHPEKKFEIYIVTLEPGCVHGEKTHLGEEYILIKEGQLTIQLQGEIYVLGSGDAMQFPSGIPHNYSNLTKEQASFFLLMHYPESDEI
ncbi:DNA-binding protein [Paenibacillus sp. CAA11]|uniref:helix-turn-helix domain-containing protein n=1 Tax=Paenibacillus sp. CAA11 TaxID=1532905 RepID=UPI000D34F3C1|nr:helix-turn-helix domain-containing protein [Paenibacillus sp. CAA11]AWB45000.1 DNA-binding protein [Paenibacillus sp. CAA11]